MVILSEVHFVKSGGVNSVDASLKPQKLHDVWAENICYMHGLHCVSTSHQLHNKGSWKVKPQKEYHQKGPLILQINIDIHGDNYYNSRQIPAISAAVLGKKGVWLLEATYQTTVAGWNARLLLTNITIRIPLKQAGQTLCNSRITIAFTINLWLQHLVKCRNVRAE